MTDNSRVKGGENMNDNNISAKKLNIDSFNQTKKFQCLTAHRGQVLSEGITLDVKLDDNMMIQTAYMIIGSDVISKLDNPSEIKIAVLNDVMIIGNDVPSASSKFAIKSRGKHYQIQAKNFIDGIFRYYGLDVKEERIELDDIDYQIYNDKLVAIIKVHSELSNS